MGVIKRQTIKSSLVSYIGVVIGAFNMLYIFPAFLEAKEIGLYRVLFSAATLFSSISLLGTSQLQVRFFSFFEDKKDRSRFLTFNLIIATSGFLLYLVVFNLFKDPILSFYKKNSPLILDYYPLIYFITFLLMFFTFWSAYSRTLKRIVIPNLLKEVTTRVGVLILASFYAIAVISFDTFLNGVILVYTIIAGLVLVYSYRLQAVGFSSGFRKIDSDMLKRMLKFALFSTITGAAGSVVGNIDTLMVSGFKDLDQTGIYTIAFFMGAVIEIPKRSLSQIAAPIVAQSWKDNNLKEISSIYKKSSINQFVFGSFILICLWLNLDYVFEIMPNGEIYSQGKYVVVFIALGKLFDMITGVNSEIIANSRYYYFNLFFIVFLAVVTVLTNEYFIPIYGINGAAGASLLSLVLFNTLKLIFLLVKFKIQPFSVNTLKVILIGISITLLINLLPEFANPFINVLVRVVLVIILFVPLIIGLKVSEDLNQIWKGIVRKLR